MEVKFDAVIFKEGKTFVAYCPELDVSSCGDTVEEAKRMIKEAISIFTEEIVNRANVTNRIGGAK